MANQTMDVRILIRNATAEEWSASNPVLLKGEFGVELGTTPADNKIKIGDGITAWNSLAYTYDLASIIAQIPHGGEVFQLTKTNLTDSDDTVLATVDSPENGDVAVVTTIVEEVEYEKSGYIYNGSAWVALSGAVDADKVILRGEVTLAGNYANVGNISKGSTSATGSYDWNAQSVQDFLINIFTQVQQPSITAQPSISITLANSGAKEVGTSFTPSYTTNFNPGSYTAFSGQVATGVTVSSYAVTDTNSGSASTGSGSFDAFTVEDDTNYRCSVTAQYTAGNTAKDNVGNDSNPPVAIAAGSASANSAYVTGYRSVFAGANVTPITLDSEGIRGLTGKTGRYTNTFSLTIPSGCTQVVIALPNGHQVTAVADQNAFGTDIFSAFVASTAQVEGLNGYTAAQYNVYVYTPAVALSANTYTITCA